MSGSNVAHAASSSSSSATTESSSIAPPPSPSFGICSKNNNVLSDLTNKTRNYRTTKNATDDDKNAVPPLAMVSTTTTENHRMSNTSAPSNSIVPSNSATTGLASVAEMVPSYDEVMAGMHDVALAGVVMKRIQLRLTSILVDAAGDDVYTIVRNIPSGFCMYSTIALEPYPKPIASQACAYIC
jgi:hypothetical protein